MQNGMIQPCPYCQSVLDLLGPVYISSKDSLNDIYVCNICGLVFKPFLNANPTHSTSNVYSPQSWDYEYASHVERLGALVDIASSHVDVAPGDPILDVGAGVGMFYSILEEKKRYQDARHVALEPVRENALAIKRKFPKISVVNSDLNTAAIPPNSFKLILLSGVDYLFSDIRAGFEKIASAVRDGGRVFVGRNVFLDQTAYVGKEIKTVHDLFDSNPIIRNWFLSEQYEYFLGQFLEVLEVKTKVQKFGNPGVEYMMFFNTYVCTKKKTAANPIPVYVPECARLRDANLGRLRRLGWASSDGPICVN